VKACRGGGVKKAQQLMEGSETGMEKIGKNWKEKKKSNIAKHQNKNRDGGGGGREKGMRGTRSRDIK
jgi:hypothetical protein